MAETGQNRMAPAMIQVPLDLFAHLLAHYRPVRGDVPGAGAPDGTFRSGTMTDCGHRGASGSTLDDSGGGTLLLPTAVTDRTLQPDGCDGDRSTRAVGAEAKAKLQAGNGDHLVQVLTDFQRQLAAMQAVVRIEHNTMAEAQNPANVVAPAVPPDSGSRGRLRWENDFNDVWLGGVHYDLRERIRARLCLKFMEKRLALDPTSARHLRDEIDLYAREKSGMGARGKFSQIKIQDYFREPTGHVIKLCQALVRSAGNGKYYLQT